MAAMHVVSTQVNVGLIGAAKHAAAAVAVTVPHAAYRCYATSVQTGQHAEVGSSSGSNQTVGPSSSRPRSAIFNDAYLTRNRGSGDRNGLKGAPIAEDSDWRLDPYGVMLASKPRNCALSKSTMPSAFLLSLRPGVVVDPKTKRDQPVLLADGLLHPKYKRRRAGKGMYVALHHRAVGELSNPRHQFFRASYADKNLRVGSHIRDQVSVQLRQRVLQELELLRGMPQARGALRVLDDAEAEAIRSGVAPVGDKKITAILDLAGVSPSHDEVDVDSAVASLSELGPRSDQGLAAAAAATAVLRETLGESHNKPIRANKPKRLVDDTMWHGRSESSTAYPLLPCGQVSESQELASTPGAEVDGQDSVPLYSVKSVFGAYAARVSALVEDIVHGDVAKANSTPADDGKAPSKSPSSVMVALQVPNSGRRDIGVPLAVALWRLRLWAGVGWEVGSRFEVR